MSVEKVAEAVKESRDKEKQGDGRRFLAFSLCQEAYAIPLLMVKEVIAPTDITPVPFTPSHFKGIMNLRGQVISIIDLRLKFKMPKAEMGQEATIIILDLAPLYLGVIVDSVDSVLAVSDAEIKAKPDIESQVKTDYIMGVTMQNKKLTLLLDVEKALGTEDLRLVKAQSQQKAAA